MTNKIILLSTSRVGSTALCSIVQSYFFKKYRNHPRIISEILHYYAHWQSDASDEKRTGINNSFRNVNGFTYYDGITLDQAKHQMRVFVRESEQFIIKYSSLYDDVFSLKEMLELINDNKLECYFLYREDVIDMVISSIAAKMYDYPDKSPRNIHEHRDIGDISRAVCSAITSGYINTQITYDFFKKHNKIINTIKFEDLEFNQKDLLKFPTIPVTDIDVHAANQKVMTPQIREYIFELYPTLLDNIHSRATKLANDKVINIDSNFRYTP